MPFLKKTTIEEIVREAPFISQERHPGLLKSLVEENMLLRLPHLDLADDHKWGYFLTVHASFEGRVRPGSIMIMPDTHAFEDFQPCVGIPPPLPNNELDLRAHFDYTNHQLDLMSHLAAIAYLGLVDRMIIVYPTGDYAPPLVLGGTGVTSEGPGIYKGIYLSGQLCEHISHVRNHNRRQYFPNFPLDTQHIALHHSEIMVREPRKPITVYFCPMEMVPCCAKKLVSQGSNDAFYNIDGDYFFPDQSFSPMCADQRIDPNIFAQTHAQLKRILNINYALFCTSTDRDDNMPGVQPSDLSFHIVPLIREVHQILAP